MSRPAAPPSPVMQELRRLEAEAARKEKRAKKDADPAAVAPLKNPSKKAKVK